MDIPKELNDEIWEFCRLNKITNIDDFTLKLLKQGFTVEKFGSTPITKTVEKIVEVPVEKIVEVPVEKIVEVPVQMVDNELIEKYKVSLSENESIKVELEKTKKLLEIEKNKKDIYGEK
jgi:hypothetical protein